MRYARITNDLGESVDIALQSDGDREVAVVAVDGVPCHLERISAEDLSRRYRVDSDPAYVPKADQAGFTYMLVPFCR